MACIVKQGQAKEKRQLSQLGGTCLEAKRGVAHSRAQAPAGRAAGMARGSALAHALFSPLHPQAALVCPQQLT